VTPHMLDKYVTRYGNSGLFILKGIPETHAAVSTPSLGALRAVEFMNALIDTASQEYDFVSRYFWPANGGDEDPVTGSAHAGLAPLWAEILNKNELLAYQASRRGGILHCIVKDDRIFISCKAVQYLKGKIVINA